MNCAFENSNSQQFLNFQICVTVDHGNVEVARSELTVNELTVALNVARGEPMSRNF